MEIRVRLSDAELKLLKERAEVLNISTDEMASKILNEGLNRQGQERTIMATDYEHDDLSIDAVVKRIRATAPNPNAVIPATKTGDQIAILQQPANSREPELSPDEWDRIWQSFEAELKRIDRQDDITDGRT